jgi:biopolymer transport protein ExbD
MRRMHAALAVSIHRHPLVVAAALVAVAAGLLGCYVPEPVAHAELQVSAQGAYALDGVNIPAQELSSRLVAAKPPGHDLVVQIAASSTAPVEAIRAAVVAVKSAQARVAFAKGARVGED